MIKRFRKKQLAGNYLFLTIDVMLVLLIFYVTLHCFRRVKLTCAGTSTANLTLNS